MNKILPVLVFLSSISALHATEYSFNATGTSSDPAAYGTDANWTPSGSPVAGDTADFEQPVLGAANFVDLTAGGTAGTVNFSGSPTRSYILENGTLTMNNLSADSAITVLASAAVAPSITSAIQIAGDGNLTLTNASATTLTQGASATSGDILGDASTASTTLTVNNTGGGNIILSDLSDNGAAAGLGLVMNSGTGGFIELGAQSSFLGMSNTIQEGLVLLGSGAGLGSSAAGTTTIDSGGALNINGKGSLKMSFVLNGSGSGTTSTSGSTANNGALVDAATGQTATTNTSTINGGSTSTVRLASNSTIAVDGTGAYLNISEAVTGTGALTLVGGGTLALSSSSASSYSGGTNIQAGILVANTASSLGTGNVAVGGGATLTLGSGSAMSSTANLTFASTSVIDIDYNSTSQILESLENTTTGVYAAAGTYTAAQLDTFFGGSEFADSTGTGTFDVLTSAVPEPSTYALLGVGIAFLVPFFRRRSVMRF